MPRTQGLQPAYAIDSSGRPAVAIRRDRLDTAVRRTKPLATSVLFNALLPGDQPLQRLALATALRRRPVITRRKKYRPVPRATGRMPFSQYWPGAQPMPLPSPPAPLPLPVDGPVVLEPQPINATEGDPIVHIPPDVDQAAPVVQPAASPSAIIMPDLGEAAYQHTEPSRPATALPYPPSMPYPYTTSLLYPAMSPAYPPPINVLPDYWGPVNGDCVPWYYSSYYGHAQAGWPGVRQATKTKASTKSTEKVQKVNESPKRAPASRSDEDKKKLKHSAVEQVEMRVADDQSRVKIHVCMTCGKPRSSGYHHHHPVQHGQQPQKAECAKCAKKQIRTVTKHTEEIKVGSTSTTQLKDPSTEKQQVVSKWSAETVASVLNDPITAIVKVASESGKHIAPRITTTYLNDNGRLSQEREGRVRRTTIILDREGECDDYSATINLRQRERYRKPSVETAYSTSSNSSAPKTTQHKTPVSKHSSSTTSSSSATSKSNVIVQHNIGVVANIPKSVVKSTHGSINSRGSAHTITSSAASASTMAERSCPAEPKASSTKLSALTWTRTSSTGTVKSCHQSGDLSKDGPRSSDKTSSCASTSMASTTPLSDHPTSQQLTAKMLHTDLDRSRHVVIDFAGRAETSIMPGVRYVHPRHVKMENDGESSKDITTEQALESCQNKEVARKKDHPSVGKAVDTLPHTCGRDGLHTTVAATRGSSISDVSSSLASHKTRYPAVDTVVESKDNKYGRGRFQKIEVEVERNRRSPSASSSEHSQISRHVRHRYRHRSHHVSRHRSTSRADSRPRSRARYLRLPATRVTTYRQYHKETSEDLATPPESIISDSSSDRAVRRGNSARAKPSLDSMNGRMYRYGTEPVERRQSVSLAAARSGQTHRLNSGSRRERGREIDLVRDNPERHDSMRSRVVYTTPSDKLVARRTMRTQADDEKCLMSGGLG